MNSPRVSFVLATHNRQDVVLRTLDQLSTAAVASGSSEVLVVDNASTDGTVDAIAGAYPSVRVISLKRNRGSCAKSIAVERAVGEYIVFLDDDSCPHPDSVERMIQHFRADERLAAAGFLVHLPNGEMECSALPNVFIGCGVGFRASALRSVGGLDTSLFMQAEEYDLSFRLVNNGWRVKTFADLHVDHLKTQTARLSARTAYFDTRNNLLLVDRYLSSRHRRTYRSDWVQRYRWLASDNGHKHSFNRARAAASVRGVLDRLRFTSQRLSDTAFESLFRVDDISNRLKLLRSDGARRIVFADLGKNMHAFHHGARRAGLTVLGILDDRFARQNRRYRGVAVMPVADSSSLRPDAVVVANTSFVHAAETRRRLNDVVDVPVHSWFELPPVRPEPHFSLRPKPILSDTSLSSDRGSSPTAAGYAST